MIGNICLCVVFRKTTHCPPPPCWWPHSPGCWRRMAISWLINSSSRPRRPQPSAAVWRRTRASARSKRCCCFPKRAVAKLVWWKCRQISSSRPADGRLTTEESDFGYCNIFSFLLISLIVLQQFKEPNRSRRPVSQIPFSRNSPLRTPSRRAVEQQNPLRCRSRTLEQRRRGW
jgi:hypothetical protein